MFSVLQSLRPVCEVPCVARPQAIAGVLWAMPKRPSGPSRTMPPWPTTRSAEAQLFERRPTRGCGAPKARVRHTSTRGRLLTHVASVSVVTGSLVPQVRIGDNTSK
jgi:hypothetical protein